MGRGNNMLQREERQNFEIPPVVLLCYQNVVPIREDRMLATAGPNMVILDKKGTEVFQYKIIRLAEYQDGQEIPEHIINQIRQKIEWDSFVDKLNKGEFQSKDREFVDNLLIISDGKKFGLVDYDGNILLDTKYNQLQFQHGIDGSIILSHLP